MGWGPHKAKTLISNHAAVELQQIEQENHKVPYVPPILGQLLDLISPPKITISEPRFGLYDPWDLAN